MRHTWSPTKHKSTKRQSPVGSSWSIWGVSRRKQCQVQRHRSAWEWLSRIQAAEQSEENTGNHSLYTITPKQVVCSVTWQQDSLESEVMGLHCSCFSVGKPCHKCRQWLTPTSLQQQPLQIGWQSPDTKIWSDLLQTTTLPADWTKPKGWKNISEVSALSHWLTQWENLG